jgi:hypothetical protein
MALTKVATVIYIRELLLAKGEKTTDKFLETLSPEEKQCFQTLLPSTKLPIEQVARFAEQAVPLLFPDKSLTQGLWELGYQNAKNDMKGMYRVLLKVATLEMVIKQAAVIWKTYHGQGKASVQRLPEKRFIFIVENYPEIPKKFLDVLTGYITGLANLAGVANVEVVCDDTNPNAWKWFITVK